jgi:hypothetical protein
MIGVADIQRVEALIADMPKNFEWLEFRDIKRESLLHMAEGFLEVWAKRVQEGDNITEILLDTMANSFRFGFEAALEFGKKEKHE